ncbi:MAG: hypothetical protein ACR2N9_06830 [Acidimicrobiia bacterium]
METALGRLDSKERAVILTGMRDSEMDAVRKTLTIVVVMAALALIMAVLLPAGRMDLAM